MSKTLEELGYEKEESEYNILFRKDNKTIYFAKTSRVFCGEEFTYSGNVLGKAFSMEELKAIYKYCEELGWI